jgi:hypothetical protein
MEAGPEKKQTWPQSLNAGVQTMNRKNMFLYVGVTIIYLGIIVMMIAIPLKLVPSVPEASIGNDPNVMNNNNYLPSNCPLYTIVANGYNPPFSDGPLQLPYQRPVNECRTFTSEVMEKLISNVTGRMVDKDLARVFENAYPNTLGTVISQ